MKKRFQVSLTVGLILINEKNQVLLMKRCNTGYMDNMYAFVSGHLEENESLSDAIIRESKEEINIDICIICVVNFYYICIFSSVIFHFKFHIFIVSF